MEFVDDISKVKIVFSQEVDAFFKEYSKEYDFKIESGGIIIGKLNPAANQVIVTDITTPFQKDKRGRYFFRRAEYGHQQEMDRLWEESDQKKTYLGEWHTHNQEIPEPSHIDKKDWKRIERTELNYKQPFFIIVGRNKLKVWTVSNAIVREMKEV